MKKALILLPLLIPYLGFNLPMANAQTIPPLSVCIAPNGSLITSYSTGTHGIPGDTNTYSGSDSVYSITNDYTMQCFCPENGSGIQTDWIKANLFTEDEIKVLISKGWIYIPEGSAWGLSDEAYLAKNTSYSCKSSGGSSGSSSSSSSGVGGASATSSNNNGGSVLGLANTGNSAFIATLLITGIVSISSSFLIKKKTA